MVSHQSAGELQGLGEKPAAVIPVTVPTSRRITPIPGLVIHLSDVPERRVRYPAGELPMTLVVDTVIALAEACTSIDDVYGWVARALGRNDDAAVDGVGLPAGGQARRKTAGGGAAAGGTAGRPRR